MAEPLRVPLERDNVEWLKMSLRALMSVVEGVIMRPAGSLQMETGETFWFLTDRQRQEAIAKYRAALRFRDGTWSNDAPPMGQPARPTIPLMRGGSVK